jgi:DNA-binding MarR family transcriptional regulator
VNESLLARLLQESRRLNDAAREARAQWLEDAGMTALELRLLDWLESAGSPLSPRHLARPLLRTASEIEGRLRAMQARAWVAEVARNGRRPAAFEICPAGRRALASFRLVERGFDTAFGSGLGEAELRAAVSLLCRVRGRLQSGRQRRRRARGRGAAVAGEFDRPRRTTASWAESAGATGA